MTLIKTISLTMMILLYLSACTPYQREKLSHMGQPPVMQEVENPVEKRERNPIKWLEPYEEPEKSQPNSLWQPGASAFFKDHRARKIGDILSVKVKINDKAELDNKTTRDRKAQETGAAPIAFGLEKLATGWAPGKANPANLFNIDMANNSEGTGTIDREEVIETEIAVMVTQILPNSNLVINGSQEVRVNHELRQIVVEGIVRPEDISAGNSIDSNLIAEARIAYGGKGLLSELQQPRIGHQIIDLFSPF